MIKPIMSKQVEEDVINSLSQFRNRGLWSKWGMESLREQGEAILLSGPPGCLSGDTKVNVKRGKRNGGRSISLRNFFIKFNGLSDEDHPFDLSIPTYIQSYDFQNQKMVYNEVISVIRSGIKPTYRLETTCGMSIVLTEDHPILGIDNQWYEAKELEEGSQIKIRGSMIPEKWKFKFGPRKGRVTVEALAVTYPSGWYHLISNQYEYKRNFKARLVYEAMMNGMDYDEYIKVIKNPATADEVEVIPEDMVIHHKDKNCSNDGYDNLELLTKLEHDRLHGGFEIEHTRFATIAKLEYVLDQQTYDIQMKAPHHNFVAENFIVHNTGKTTIAKWIANQIGKGFKQLDMSQLQSDGTPGSTESKVDEFFDDCKRRHNCTIFMDECEAILISRDSIGEAGLTWQLGTVNKIITRMNLYRGLILAATNHSSLMDSALTDRFISIIHVKRPDEQSRRRLWKQKIPRSFPLKSESQVTNQLARFDLSGRQIETVIINCASNALRLGKAPSIQMMEQYCQRETKKHL